MKQKMHTLLVDVLNLENIRKVARLDRMQPFFVFSSYIILFQWMLRYRNYKKSCKLHQVRSLKCNYYKVVQKPR